MKIKKLLLMFGAILILSGCSSKIDLMDYVIIDLQGKPQYGSGMVSATLDKERLFDHYLEKNGNDWDKTFEDIKEIEAITRLIIEPKNNLSVDDSIAIRIDVNKNDRVKGGTKTFTVKELMEK